MDGGRLCASEYRGGQPRGGGGAGGAHGPGSTSWPAWAACRRLPIPPPAAPRRRDLFMDTAAAVVCRKLGMVGGRTLRNVNWGATGLRVGISNVRCLGSEYELRCGAPCHAA